MKFQAKIDGVQAGQPFEAPDLAVAEQDAARTWEALRCGDALLTTNGETLVVEVSHDCDANARPVRLGRRPRPRVGVRPLRRVPSGGLAVKTSEAAPAWPDGTRVTILAPHELAGAEGEVIDWDFAFASASRRYWIQLDEAFDPVHVHESELRREEPS